MIYPTVLQLVSAPVAGLRQWRLAIRIDLVRSVPKIAAAGVGLVISKFIVSDEAFGIIAFTSLIAIATMAVATWELFTVMRRVKMHQASIVYELYSTPLAAVLSAFAASGLAKSMIEPAFAHLSPRASASIETVVAGFIYVSLSFVLLRFGYTSTLERLLEALPDFAKPGARRLFRLGV
jgi:hypothetical protein